MFQRLPVAVCCICLSIGVLGFIGSLLPVLSVAEESIGLDLLYRLRGPEKPEADVVVVAIDRKSAKAFDLPTAANKWPRILHARLLEQLTAMGAAVVAFDLIFHESQLPADDQALASAIARAGNVILTQPIDRETMSFENSKGDLPAHVNIEKMVSAIPVIAEAALTQAPFPLPKVPVQLNQFWRFSPGSGDVPTLPVVVMHAFAMDAFDEFLSLMKKVDASAASTLPAVTDDKGQARQIVDAIRPLYFLFENDPALVRKMFAELDRLPPQQLNSKTTRLVRAFIELYAPGNSRYLNLYGPPGSIDTISYYQLLHPTPSGQGRDQKEIPSLKGKAVFVGQTESDWFKANDGFYTAFTESSGMDISGVEIAATAFANLLEGRAVRPLRPFTNVAMLIGWGSICVLISIYFSTLFSATGLLLLNGTYLWLAYAQFKSGGIWYPLVVPTLVQSPAAFMAGLVWRYRKVNIERRNIREAFGYYLPDAVVDRLSSNTKDLRAGGQVLYSICLVTDAESYTTLSETMDPESLTRLMNSYYEVIFKPIKDNDGLVLQVIGDSVLALWTAAQPLNKLKSAACKTAIEITEAVRQFNEKAGRRTLPTRIGIHAGEILLGNIGAIDHYEYRPVGDIVNTASRLEGLNKYLGTRMLASEDVTAQINGCSLRSVGRFVFKGKSQPVRVLEIIPGFERSRKSQELCRLFESGLRAFESRHWDEAEKYFNQVLEIEDNDGPSHYYRKLCQNFRQSPPDSDWDGTVYLTQK